MHHIYHTEGIILGSRNTGESGKYYYIFTKELGMIYATASGVRKMSSKLRFILQDYAYLKIDLVQGQNFFRITSASKTNQLGEIIKRPETLKIFHNIARLLKRLLAGVEPNQDLFIDVLNNLLAIEKIKEKSDLDNAEAVMVLRILHNLGYIGFNENINELVKSPFEADIILEASKVRMNMLREINKALKETHL